MNRDIANMRENYSQNFLNRDQLSEDPISQFNKWFDEVTDSEILEPNAMILSTVSQYNTPSARTVLLKEMDESGFIFYTNYTSDKAKDIESNPNVALTFLWKEVERQVRIQGTAKKISRQRSLAYYHKRPKGSQVGAWISPQSSVIDSREILENKQTELSDKYADVDQLPIPEFWGGFIVEPNIMEFWQGRPSRLHDRFRYTKSNTNWIIDRLAP